MTSNVIPIGINRVETKADELAALIRGDRVAVPDTIADDMDSRVEYLNTILAGTGIVFEAPPKPKPPSLVYGYGFIVVMAVLGAIVGHWLSIL